MGQANKTNEEKKKEAEELVEKVTELLKEREKEKFVLKYEEYDEDEDDDFDDDDFDEDDDIDDDDDFDADDDEESRNKYDVFVESGDEDNYAIFYGLGWCINDEIYLRKLYLDDDALMLSLLNRPYDAYAGEWRDYELLDDFYAGDIVGRLGTIERLDEFIEGMKKVVELMEK